MISKQEPARIIDKIPTWTLPTLMFAGATWPLCVLAIRKLGPWGEFWGIDEEGWATVWATFVSAALAATVAISVLRGQNKHLAKIAEDDRADQSDNARLDRAHQADIARIEREVPPALELREATHALTEHASKVKADTPNSSSLLSEVLQLHEVAVYKWAVNSGLSPTQTRTIIDHMLSSAKTLVEFQGYHTFHQDSQSKYMNDLMEKVLMNVTADLDEKWKILEDGIKLYDDTLSPLRIKTLQEYKGRPGVKNQFGEVLIEQVSVTIDTD